MMTDFVYSLQSANKTKNLQGIVPKPRLQSAPILTKYTRKPDEDAPQSLLCHPIVINNHYFDSEYILNLKSIHKLNDLITSFFTSQTADITPYSETEWTTILQDSNRSSEDPERLSNSLRNGLPTNLRKEIWLYLAHTEQQKRKYIEQGITYESLREQACLQEEKIKQDLSRTCADHEFFQTNNQEKINSLNHVLKAYANLDLEVGYAQGLNYIVGMLLYLVHSISENHTESDSQPNNEGRNNNNNLEKVEQNAFWILVYIMQEKGWRALFIRCNPKLVDLLQKLDVKVKDTLPQLHVILKQHNCLACCFVDYFITMMLYKCPPEMSRRILEIFLFVGEDILIHIITNMLALCENEIEKRQDCDDELFTFLKDHLLMAISK